MDLAENLHRDGGLAWILCLTLSHHGNQKCVMRRYCVSFALSALTNSYYIYFKNVTNVHKH